MHARTDHTRTTTRHNGRPFGRRRAETPRAPTDNGAERSILGAVIVDNNQLTQVGLEQLEPADFYQDAHQVLFRHQIALHASGTPIDFHTLVHALRSSGELDAVGGVEYVSALDHGLPRATNARYYARIVKEQAARRTLWALGHRLVTDAASGTDLAEITARATQALADLSVPSEALAASDLEDAADVAAEGRQIATDGIRYLLDGIIPAYGMLGFLVAYTKVGKTTFGQALAAHVAMGRPFLERAVRQRVKVLVLAAEDPKEYTAWLARDLEIDRNWMTFRRLPLVLNATTLGRIATTVRVGGYGFVLIASWQAVVRGLIEEENDNAGAVVVVEDVKAVARDTGVPWLIDAHSGKGEDQSDDADPLKAMRGASGAAAAADYTLSLRYENGTFGTRRRLSGKGRFVSFAPIAMDFDPATSSYAVAGASGATSAAKDAYRETTWRQICEMGALDTTPRSITEIAQRAGLIAKGARSTATQRRRVTEALKDRPEVGFVHEVRGGKKTACYRRLGDL